MPAQTANGLSSTPPERSLGSIAEAAPPIALPGPVALSESVALRPGRRALIVASPAGPSPPFADRAFAHKRCLELADMAAVAAAVALSLSLFDANQVALLALASLPLALLVFKIGGLHRDELRLLPSTLDETPAIFQLTGLFALAISLLQSVTVGDRLQGAQVALVWFVAFAFVLACRTVARLLVRRFGPSQRCLIVGDVDQAQNISNKLAATRAPAVVVGCLPLSRHVEDLWTPAGIRQVVAEIGADRIIIAATTAQEEWVAEFIRVGRTAGVNISILPRTFELVGSGDSFDHIDGLTILGVRPFGLSRSARTLKRAFDLLATTVGILVVAPTLVAVAAAIKLDSRGPVFFRQVRVGRDGRHFKIFKFRSMVTDADARKGELRLLNEAGDGLFKITNDPRVTRAGRFLRRTSLDELPQIFNVLRGDMSLVGPRPLVIEEDARVVGLDRSRLHLTPGMTGPWQVLNARGQLQEMLALDYVYVANWSLWSDLKILVRTVVHVARQGNA